MKSETNSLILRFKIEFDRSFVHMWRLVRGFPFKKSVTVTDSIFVGGQFRVSKLHHLLDWGITGVVSMRTRYPKSLDAQSQIGFLNLPTKDNRAPTNTQLHKGVDFINQHIDAGGKVYIHCRMGEGRGPTMAAAFLVSQGLTTKDAIATITSVRKFLKITTVQQERLEQFSQSYVIN